MCFRQKVKAKRHSQRNAQAEMTHRSKANEGTGRGVQRKGHRQGKAQRKGLCRGRIKERKLAETEWLETIIKIWISRLFLNSYYLSLNVFKLLNINKIKTDS